MQTKPNIFTKLDPSMFNSNTSQSPSPLVSIMTEKKNLIDNMEDIGRISKRISAQDRKVYNEWISIQPDSDEKRLEKYTKLIAVYNDFFDFVNKRPRSDIHQILYTHYLFSRNTSTLDLFLDTDKDKEEATETYSLRYQTYYYRLFLTGIQIDQIMALLKNNPSTKEWVEERSVQDIMNEARKSGSYNGHEPTELSFIALLSALDKAAFYTSSVKKDYIRLLENNLNALLKVDSYKKLGGLQTLSRTMERYFAVYGTFDKMNVEDLGIIAITYALMVLQAPWQAVMSSCYIEWIENLSDVEGDKLILHSTILKVTKDDMAGYEIDDVVDALLEERYSEAVGLQFAVYETCMVSTGLSGFVTDTTQMIHIYLSQPFYVNYIRKTIVGMYELEEWEKMDFDEKCVLVSQLVFFSAIKVSINAQRHWMPRNVMEYIGYAPEIDFSKKKKNGKNSQKKSSQAQNNKKLEKAEKDLASVKSQNKSLNEEIESLKRQLKNTKDEAKQLRIKTHEQDKAIEEAQIELHKDDLKSEEREELNRLREYAFSISDNEQKTEVMSDSIDEELIRNAGEIVILGGHTTLCRKIVDKYSNIRWIDGRKRVPFDMIKNASHVFFLFDFMSHGTYYEGCKLCTANHVPFDYIQGTNLQRAEHQMIQALS